jgi:acetoin utilization deacetylase AcuC-like enzyme
MVRVLDSDDFLDHETGDHVEQPDRLRAIREVLQETGLLDGIAVEEPAPASRDLLEAVHDPDHVDEVQALAAAGGGRVDADTVASAGTYRAGARAAGAAVAAAETALEGTPALSLGRPPGHHATRDRAMGFCFFNHAAVAASAALDRGCDQVAVLDHDVHHGNGTQDIFYGTDDVLYVSVHQSPLYPGTGDVTETGTGAGGGATVNVPVPAGLGDAGYRRVLEEIVFPVLDEASPDLLLVSAGYDTHHRDPLGGLHLSSAFYAETARALLDLGAPTAFVLEGGYDLQGLARGVAAEVAVVADEPVPGWDEDPPAGKGADDALARAREVHGERWDLDCRTRFG